MSTPRPTCSPGSPTGTARVLIHGTADATVGIEQSRTFARAAAAAGDPTDLIELEDEGHYAFLDPRQPAFQTLCDVLGALALPELAPAQLLEDRGGHLERVVGGRHTGVDRRVLASPRRSPRR